MKTQQLKPFNPILKRKPDLLEKGIRFGCGAMFGIFLLLFMVVR
jgi:hypothetical protein